MTFSDKDKLKALAIVNIFETSRPFGDYAACVVLNDGAGVSYGINQFTQRSGSLATVVETYLNKGGMIGDEVLRSSLPILRQRSAAAIGRLAVDEQFKKALRAAAAAAAADTETGKATTTVTGTAEQQTAPPAPTGPVDLPTWLEAAQPKWQWRVRFQTAVYHQLDRITRGRGTRLMIFMPPRHGKSELVTIRYSAWRLTRDPGLRIVIGSYNQRLANKFSRSIKRAYTSAPVGDPFAGKPALTLNAMEEWETPQGGGVKAVGAGAGITGYGADLIIIDDPIKSRAAAAVEVDPPDSGLFTSRIFDNCRAMARLYAGKRNISVSVR